MGPTAPLLFAKRFQATPFLPYIRDFLSPPSTIIIFSYLTLFQGNHWPNK